jgi:hypothetical protein
MPASYLGLGMIDNDKPWHIDLDKVSKEKWMEMNLMKCPLTTFHITCPLTKPPFHERLHAISLDLSSY